MEFEFKAEATLVMENVQEKRRKGTATLKSTNLSPTGNSILSKSYWDLLLNLYPKSDRQRPSSEADRNTINWKVKVKVSRDEHRDLKNYMNLTDDGENGILQRLHGALGWNKYKVGVSVNITVSGEPDVKVAYALDMEYAERNRQASSKAFKGIVTYFDNHPDCKFEKLFDTEVPLNASMKVVFQLSDRALDILRLKSMKDPLSINRMLLADTESADTLIIPGDGEAVHCHKLFLTAQSPAFQAMFRNDMKEKSTNTLKLVDMTDAGVRALLAYLYTWELAGASGNASVAIELLLAADKYEMGKLEEDVRELILSKRPTWFTANDAQLLLGFAEAKIAVFERVPQQYILLKEKADEVLKSKTDEIKNECEVHRGLELLNISGAAGAPL